MDFDIIQGSSLQSVLEEMGENLIGSKLSSVGGGCINQCFIMCCPSGAQYFIKKNRFELKDMFQAEAFGLIDLKKQPGPSLPAPLAMGEDGKESFLILEKIESSSLVSNFWSDFGRSLGLMHLHGEENHYGWHRDNYIGSTPQKNHRYSSWIEFFAEQRLRYQGDMAKHRGLISSEDRAELQSLTERLSEILYEPQKPQLIHGDLWSGNFIVGPDGMAWIFDPAAYWGHGEADLAMTEMFGGYHRDFYSAYREVYGEEPGYSDRREIYNLYHYLNHLNLFGSSYYSKVKSIIHKYF
ncbi:MAG: fructosamine kinase family protein [Spirochaetaceae bacterium]|jgi:protein-ribulosamine 3-kinase|nr:fructosamine kinase family protein [Spirochaetaceae bacterium]